jgi:hypothetical protein
MPFTDSLAPVQVGSKWGYINLQGSLVIPATYDEARCFVNGMARVRQWGRYGFIDKRGNSVIACLFDYAWWFGSDGLCAVQLDGKYGFINRQGNVVIAPRFAFANSFENQLAIVFDDSGSYAVRTSGDELFPTRYQSLTGYYNDRAVAKAAPGQMTILGTDGNVVAVVSCDWMSGFSDGLAIFRRAGKYGAVNTLGHTVVGATYAKLGMFSKGMAYVWVNGKFGFINAQNQLVIQPRYEEVGNFTDVRTTQIPRTSPWSLYY